MRFARYGSGWSLSIGWLHVDWSTFEDHWHLSLTWAKPWPAQQDSNLQPRA